MLEALLDLADELGGSWRLRRTVNTKGKFREGGMTR